MKQYMSNKPIKCGFKIWIHAESKSEHVSEFDIYTGKKGDRVERGLCTSVVMSLTKISKKQNSSYIF